MKPAAGKEIAYSQQRTHRDAISKSIVAIDL